MPLRTITWSGDKPLGTVASLILHLAVGAALLLLPQVHRIELPPDESISVELLPPPPAETRHVAAPRRAAWEEARARSDPLETRPERAALPRVHAMTKATKLFSADVLADPRSRKARQELRALTASDRIIQLCNIEAMEQVRRWNRSFEPDFVMAYALAGVTLGEHAAEARGGAFRSGDHWYGIEFRCEVTPDLAKVAAFEFLVGDEIPRTQWAEYNLTVGEAED